MAPLNDVAAREVLDVVPLVLRRIRKEMRRQGSADLSIPQFRSLNFVKNNQGASLKALADFLGLTAPSASKLVDGLVRRLLIVRATSPSDRRSMEISITEAGRSIVEKAEEATRASLSLRLASLPADDLQAIAAGMEALRRVFGARAG